MAKFLQVRVPLWIVLLIIFAIATVRIFSHAKGFSSSFLGANRTTQNNHIIESISKEEQVVLLGLAIQGLATEADARTVLGVDLPGTSRDQYIPYEFTAKLGLDGKDVKIERTDANEYTISIPKFIFIGHSNLDFKTPVESGGLLSWLTPRIDTTRTISNLLSDEAQEVYLEKYNDILKAQAEFFYTRIINGIDTNITLKFTYIN